MFAIGPNEAISTRLQSMIQINTLQEAKLVIFINLPTFGEPERRAGSEGKTDAPGYRTSQACLLNS